MNVWVDVEVDVDVGQQLGLGLNVCVNGCVTVDEGVNVISRVEKGVHVRLVVGVLDCLIVCVLELVVVGVRVAVDELDCVRLGVHTADAVAVPVCLLV